MVLDDAITWSHYSDGDCAGVCPGCGNIIKRFYRGVPDPLVYFAQECRDCGVTLRRWSAVVVPNIISTAPPTDDLQQRVQSYWDRQFRIGVQDLGLPHTREFSSVTQQLADKWNWDWDVRCPLCDRSVSDLPRSYLGYHHWSYDEDIGTSLCLSCHDYLHGGDDHQQASKQDWRAKKVGLADFRDLGVIRLALRDRSVHSPDVDEADEKYARRLRHRYNVPLSTERIRRLLADVRHTDDVAEIIEEHGPSPTAYRDPDIPVRDTSHDDDD